MKVYLVSTPDQIGPAYLTQKEAFDFCDAIAQDNHQVPTRLSWHGGSGVWQDIQTGDYDVREVELVTVTDAGTGVWVAAEPRYQPEHSLRSVPDLAPGVKSEGQSAGGLDADA